MRKKFICCFCVLMIIVAGLLMGCGGSNTGTEAESSQTIKEETESGQISEEYLVPDLEFYDLFLWNAYYTIENSELIIHQDDYADTVASIYDGTGYFEIEFSWKREEDEIYFGDDFSTTYTSPNTNEFTWSLARIEGQQDLIWIWKYETVGLELNTLSIYSLSQARIIAEYDLSEKGVYAEGGIYRDAVYLGQDHLLITTPHGLFVYNQGKWLDYSNEFALMEGKYRACMVVGNQVIIYSQDPTSLSSFVYNVMDHSFEQVLEPIGIEYQGYTIYALHGGYVVGNIDQKLAIVNLMNGVIVYPDIDYTKFAKVFDIDNNVLLCLKDRTQEYIYESEIGPWDIIDKMTGEVMFSGESLIKKTNQGQQAFVKISEEGQVYLGLSLLGEDGKRDIELYELEYETVK